MAEKKIEKQIKDWLTEIGAYWFKVHGSSFMPAGIPDIVACINGYFVGIEVKDKGKLYNQSPEQKIHEKLINLALGRYILADNLETVKENLCDIIKSC